jgi:hypothetical protein
MNEKVGVSTKDQETKKDISLSQKQNSDFSQPGHSFFDVDQTLYWQRNLGNQAVQRLMESNSIQAKLEISQPDDKYEQEANRAADQVMRMPEPRESLVNGHSSLVQRQSTCPECMEEEEESELEEEILQTRIFSVPPPEIPPNGVLYRQEDGEEEAIQSRMISNRLPGVTSKIAENISAVRCNGEQLPGSVRTFFEPRFRADFSAVRIHRDAHSAETARALNARAFTIGTDIVFGKGEYTPETHAGKELLGHELTHVVQQGALSTLPTTGSQDSSQASNKTANAPVVKPVKSAMPDVQCAPNCQETIEPEQAEEVVEEDVTAGPTSEIPDDEEIDPGVEFPRACQLNFSWWETLQLSDVRPIRNYDPEQHPRAWANKTIAAQRLIYAQGTRSVEGMVFRRDGILGPRTFLALRAVALDEDHPARAEIQGLGFDLDAIARAEGISYRARAEAVKPEFLLQVPINPLGENVIRYYDINFYMVTHDREVIDQLIFDNEVPPGIRRRDRIEILRRLYGQESRRLEGTAAIVTAHRDFIHREIDVSRTVQRDRRQGVDRRYFFMFHTLRSENLGDLEAIFGFSDAMTSAAGRLPEGRQAEISTAIEMLTHQNVEPQTGPRREIAALLIATYLPTPDPETRSRIVSEYITEKEEQERQERELRELHNLEVARQRADILVALIEDEETAPLVRYGRFLTQLQRNLAEKQFFELVIDNLMSREGNMFDRLFDEVEELRSEQALRDLVTLCLAGRYADHPRVQQAMGTLQGYFEEHREHVYDVSGDGAVLLEGDVRLEKGKVAGEVNPIYLKDENKERLKPDSQERFMAELERQTRAYMARLNSGQEPSRTQDEIGELLLQRAWQSANMDEDSDIEDIEIEESIRLLGVRPAAPGDAGIQRYDVQYEVVKRIVGYTDWETVEGTGGWRSETEFENKLWWYSYSQVADIVETAAIIVSVGAVIIVAWEAGVIAALVSAGGGALPVGLSIGISMAIYWFTHERHTLEGLLVAGIQGYLAALGFRVFAPVGAAVGRLALPAALEQATFRQVVTAWLLRHGTTGALTGGTTTPAALLVEDIIRIAGDSGSLSPINAYIQSAAWGMFLGAVFEIGGSALLSPIFRTADRTVLQSLAEVIDRLRGAGITRSQWLAEATGALSNFRTWLSSNMDDAIADGLFATARARLREAGNAYVTGLRATLHTELLTMAEVQLTREAVDGLERLLRLGTGTIDDSSMTRLLGHVMQTPERINPWLRFIGEVDDEILGNMIRQNQLQGLANSPAILALASRRTTAEIGGLLSSRFNNSLEDLNNFAARLNALDDEVADSLLGLLRTHGTSVTPITLLRMAESGVLDEEALAGLTRLMQGSPNRANLERLLELTPDENIGAFLTMGRTGTAEDLVILHTLSSNPAQGAQLLTVLDDAALQNLRGIPGTQEYFDLIATDLSKGSRLLRFGAFDRFADFQRVFNALDDTALTRMLAVYDDAFLAALSTRMRGRYELLLREVATGTLDPAGPSFIERLTVLGQVRGLRSDLAQNLSPQAQAAINIGQRNLMSGTFNIQLPGNQSMSGNGIALSGRGTSQSLIQDVGNSFQGRTIIPEINTTDQIFTPTVGRAFHDSERKFFEHVVHEMERRTGMTIRSGQSYQGQGFSGRIDIFTEMKPCDSCTDIMKHQFRNMFGSDITVNINYGVNYP